MTRRRSAATIAAIALVFAAGAAGGWWAARRAAVEAPTHTSAAPAGSERQTTWYTCGMHPEVIQDHPGNCPKCGMKLQPMAADRVAALGLSSKSSGAERTPGSHGKILYWKSSMIPGEIHPEPGKDSMGMDLVPVYTDEVSTAGSIRIDPVTEQNMGIRVDKVVRGPLVKNVRTVGFVDYDETTLATVATKVSGWVEKLYVDETGAQVHAGDRLFDLYSPELFSAQEEYLAALRNLQVKDVADVPSSRIDSQSLLRDARTRLEHFDITPQQIAQIERTGKPQKTLTIHAPFTGIVTRKNVVEGQKINAGMDVFRIADISNVWVIAKVFEYDLPYVQLGQEALMTLSYLPGKTFRGRLTYVYPYLEQKTREVAVRMEFHNPGYELKPGMYATVTLSGELAKSATLVPDMAVIRTGTRDVAFTMPETGRFEPRQVEIGVRSENNYLQVLSGLAPGETVVVSGQFLLDSESNLREAALKFLEPGKVEAAAPIESVTRAAEGQTAHAKSGSEKKTYYVCPMPEHVDILYDKPGHCPLCGMRLVPVTRSEGHVGEPQIAYWTCPMPAHSFIHEPGPGKCPICGMSLVPVMKSESAPTPTATPGTPNTQPPPTPAASSSSPSPQTPKPNPQP
jgi:RND family efflux transporter MFP subunit